METRVRFPSPAPLRIKELRKSASRVQVIEAHRRDRFLRFFYFFACFVFESKVLACLRSG